MTGNGTMGPRPGVSGMSDNGKIDTSWTEGPSTPSADRDGEIYFRVHLLMILGGAAFYATAIGWMVWRLVVGGGFERALVPVVSVVLLSIMMASLRSMLAIAWDGRPGKEKVDPVRAQPKSVSVGTWAIQKPVKRF